MSSIAAERPWASLRIQLKKTWRELTDEDLELICRNREDLVRIVRQRCAGSAVLYVKETAEIARTEDRRVLEIQQ